MGRKSDNSFRITKECLLPGFFFCLFLRWCVAAYPYSGQNKPPMFGDYEAQRHWQEITTQTPLLKWYHNTSQNDLQYWGLDYPPLTAYHSFLIGSVASWLEPDSITLFGSRGYESESHKSFMRWSVFLSDIYFFVSATLCLCIDSERIKEKEDKNVFKRTDLAFTMMLLYPGLILIDHGHFQYNCVSLGLFLWATFFIVAIENDYLATLLFVCALHYKQMELYHALPFFVYLLRMCFRSGSRNKLMYFIGRFNKLAICVITVFILLWYPLIEKYDDFLQILHRLFPFSRGVFEDKVSNIWCAVNLFVKLKSKYTNEMMAKICLLSTACAAVPSCLDLFVRVNKKKFILSLINVSLAFFLFSFQVHEKTILLCAIPVALHLPEDPFMCFWFLLVSNFSMLPLLIKDGLIIPFVALNLIYICCYSLCIKIAYPKSGLFSFVNANLVYGTKNLGSKKAVILYLSSLSFVLSLLSMICITFGALFVEPPVMYPDLFPLLISVYSCCHFILFYLYFNFQQLRIAKSLPRKGFFKTKIN